MNARAAAIGGEITETPLLDWAEATRRRDAGIAASNERLTDKLAKIAEQETYK